MLLSARGRRPATSVIKIRDLSSVELATGQTVYIDPGSIVPPRDPAGRHGHVIGVQLDYTVQFDKVAASMPSAMPGYLLHSVFSNFRITAGGREFITNADGADLHRLSQIRDRMTVTATPADLAAADATNATASSKFVFLFGPVLERWDREQDGGIAVAALDGRRDPTSGIRWTNAANFGSFPGVTIDALTDCSVSLLVSYSDDLHIDSWYVQVGTEQRTDYTYELPGGGMLSTFAVIDRVNSTPSWTAGEVDYSNIQVTIGDDYFLRNVDYVDIAQGFNGENLGLTGGTATQETIMSESAPQFLPLIRQMPGSKRTDNASGQIRVQYTRSNHTTSRILAHGYPLQDSGFIRRIKDAAGIASEVRELAVANTPKSQEKADALVNVVPSKVKG